MGLFSAIFGGAAQKKAASKQIKESKAAQADSLGYVEPYAAAGNTALKAYLDSIGLGDSGAAIKSFEASPEYQLNYGRAIDEGRIGVGNVAQGTGTYNSGRTLKALQDRAQDTTRGFYSDYLKNLGGTADMGYNAAGLKSNIRTTGSNAIKAGYQAKADAKTAQYAGFDNLLSGGLKFLGGASPAGSFLSKGLGALQPAPPTYNFNVGGYY